MPANGGGWVPVHMTINRVELEEDTYAGLVALRLPTDEEIAAAGIEASRQRRPKRQAKRPVPQGQSRQVLAAGSTGPARAVARAGPTADPLRMRTGASTVTTTSRSSTTHWVTAVRMARANADACVHAAPVPSARCTAAASAARSAAACARWRAITADPTYTPPAVIASNTAIIATATRLAEPPLSADQVRPRRPPPLRW